MEIFTTFSIFLGSYKLFSLYDAQGYIGVTDCFKFWGRKFVRLAPFYYFIFFVGWAVFPHLGAGPVWYSANLMFDGCSETWWAQLLFIGNIYPYIQAPNYGCFFWGWTITTDMQLALLLPFFIIVYKKNVWAGHILALFTTAVCCLGIWYCCAKYDLKVGPLAEGNWYLFCILFQKPWFKLHTMMMGIVAAHFYMQILSYRKIEDPKERKEKHGFWDFVHRSQVFKICLFMFGLANILCGLLSAHTDIENAMKWTQAENVAYYTL